MRIALIQTLNPESEGLQLNRFNIDYTRGGRNPLGVAYLAAVLIEGGHEIMIIDRAAEHCKNGFKRQVVDNLTVHQLCRFAPDMIGISSLTGTFSDAVHVSRKIREKKQIKDAVIVFGGFHPTVEDQSVLKECPEVDLILKGEAEYSFLALVDGTPPERVEGITLRKDGIDTEFFSNPLPANDYNLDELPFPARHLLDMEFYTQANSAAVPGLHLESTTFISSRGCPFKCRFCGAKRMNCNVRSHSDEYVVKEIEHVLASYTVNCIVFADQMFLTDKKRVERFCDLLISKGLNKKISWTANSRVDYVDREILEYMHEAGCIWICYGFETGSQKMLDLVNKKTKVDQNIKTAKMTKAANILVSASMIAGLPGETEEDFRQSIDFLDEIKPDSAGFNLFTPLPGTDYYFDFIDQGLIDDNKDWRQLGMINVEKGISYSKIPKERLYQLVQEANQSFSIVSNRTYYQLNFLKNIQQSRIRLEYNGDTVDPLSKQCFQLLESAVFKYTDRDYARAASVFQEAIDSVPCIWPCPCPTGCEFFYDVSLLSATCFYKLKKYKKALSKLEALLSIPRLPYNRGPALSLQAEIQKMAGNKKEYKRLLQESIEMLDLNRESYRVLPGCNRKSFECSKKTAVNEWILQPPAEKFSAIQNGLIILDCRSDNKELLLKSNTITLDSINYSLSYRVNVMEGGIEIEIITDSGSAVARRRHTVSTTEALAFSLTDSKNLSISVSAFKPNRSAYINVELIEMKLCEREMRQNSWLNRIFKRNKPVC